MIDLLIPMWMLTVTCMQLIPWSIIGIHGIFQKIPDEYQKDCDVSNTIYKFIIDLFQNQIVILFSVPLGIILLDQVEIYGLIPTLPLYFYILSFLLGLSLIFLGGVVSKYVIFFMQRYMKDQLEHDLKQYAYNMRSYIKYKPWQRILLSFFNGLSEELLMRVFLMGLLINYFGVYPVIALLISIFLNGLHHTKQGRIMGSIPVVIIQSVFGVVYLIFNDFLLIGLMHMGADLAALFLLGLLNRNKGNEQVS
ncbi:MAG: CPBP family intramembrane metalloprotease [Candidatus Cloacimonetes bacterium]|nr:CPBP family intramembrane metalloprotease [Candidatus Cloacimonadota bacterium]